VRLVPVSYDIDILVCMTDELLPHFLQEFTIAFWVGSFSQCEHSLLQAGADRTVHGHRFPARVIYWQIYDVVFRSPGLAVDSIPSIK